MKLPLLIFTVFFITDVHAQQLQLVKDIFPGFKSSDPIFVTPYKGRLYYFADDSVHGKEPHVCDSQNKESMLYDINPGPASSFNEHLYNYKMGIMNDVLYFPADFGFDGAGLYKYDGTGVPVYVAKVDTPYDFITFAGRLFFNSSDPTHGTELFAYDGKNPPREYRINPGRGGSYPFGFTIYNNKLYFTATTDKYGFELYTYDPVADTVTLVQDIMPGNASSTPANFIVVNNKLYFTAATYFNGNELYAYDGVTLSRITDLTPGSGSGVSMHGRLIYYNNALYFGGSTDGQNYQLYKYAIADSSIMLVDTINKNGSADPYNFIIYGNRLYFDATDDQHGCELWVHDGYTTRLLQDINPGPYSSLPSDLTVWNNSLYINATNGVTGYELYRLFDTSAVIVPPFIGPQHVLYPNPTSGDCYITVNAQQNEQLSVHITDAVGREVYYHSLTTVAHTANEWVLPMHLFPTGIYIYHLIGQRGQLYASGKIVRR